MPAPVSKKQYRYIQAILHSKKQGTSARGDRMPRGIAEKYAHSGDKDLPESKGKEHEGGVWTDKHHEKHNKKETKKSEELGKNIIRSNGPANVVYEMTHGDALQIVKTGTFKFLKDVVSTMQDEDFKDVPIDQYILKIRKHANDIYSGRIVDGYKQIHQFVNKSLPGVAAELMSVFEWYSPEDEEHLKDVSPDEVDEDKIEGGLKTLVDNYHNHNITNIYKEMENIRQEIRQGNAVDLQQAEQKIMKLFDKLENNLLNVIDKHNTLNSEAGKAIEEIEQKLRSMQDQLEAIGKKPTTVEAYSSSSEQPGKVYNDFYNYLTKPHVEIDARSGKIRIMFGSDWTGMDQENFLSDLKAKAMKKSRAK